MTGTLLVTGFGPFGAHGSNPTERLATELDGETVRGVLVRATVLPVSYRRAVADLLATVDQVRPVAVVCCGLDARAAAVAVERLGVNLEDTGAQAPDVDGAAPRDEPVVPDGPDALFATLPVRAITAAVEAAGIPATLSCSAGTYVCNAVLYGVLHHLRRSPQPVPAGFLHFPRSTEMAVGDPRAPSMDLATMRRALAVAVETVVAHLPAVPAGRTPA